MKRVDVISTLQKAFSCVFHHPLVTVPFLVFSALLCPLILSLIKKVRVLLTFLSAPAFTSIDAFGLIFGFIGLMMLFLIVLFFCFPFFEGWTFAALSSACRNEPVNLSRAARRGISKYFGMLCITVIVAIVSVLVNSIVSGVFSAVTFASMTSVHGPFDSPLSIVSQMRMFFIMYTVAFLIDVIILVLFVYLKPAYVVGDKSLSEALNDGFDIAKKTFLPSCLIVLFFTVLQFALVAIPGLYLFMTVGVDVSYHPEAFLRFLDSLIPLGVAVLFIYFVLNTVYYAALTQVYEEVHAQES